MAQAASLRARGNKAFDEGHYVDALAAYEASAKRVPPDAALSFNLAHTYERLGRYADALAFYLRFQEGASAEQLARVSNLDQRLARLRGKVTVLRVNVNVPGARVRVRDVLVGVKQADRPVVASLDEGRAPVEISFEGYQPYYKDHTLLGGNVLDLDVMLSQQAGPTLVVEKTKTVYVSSTPFWSQWWFWAGAGALVVGGATAAYALSTEKDPRGGSLGTVSFGQRVRGAAFALTF
ncbi:MAG TPA: tetratricopeptide repeat protein [Polyangiaceae bacterium]|nr:tetratricopeptide repeat protein [Polyangiaceae bacterium]